LQECLRLFAVRGRQRTSAVPWAWIILMPIWDVFILKSPHAGFITAVLVVAALHQASAFERATKLAAEVRR
jgi:hypothetical protein